MALLWLIWKWYTVLEDFFLLDSVRYHCDVKTTLKVWLVQSQDPDVRLISQIDIVMCFIYNISAMSWWYRGWYRYNIRMFTGKYLVKQENHLLIMEYQLMNKNDIYLNWYQSNLLNIRRFCVKFRNKWTKSTRYSRKKLFN